VKKSRAPLDSKETAEAIAADIRALRLRNTPHMRAVRLRYSSLLMCEPPNRILAVTRALLGFPNLRWLAAELIINHPAALDLIGEKELLEFGRGMSHWGDVDAFAGLLAGRVWRRGQVSDELIYGWARSEDRWWRRAALVATVPLNRKAAGGTGDTVRTLAVCRILVGDRDDMVVKALSWALRDLAKRDRGAVQGFLLKHENVLAARVKREVRNKLETGLKNPKGGR
jgi:3-methyladenine DNA glycosylase AlkD